MAENLDDGEFWLPSQFLTDDEDGTSLNKLAAKNDDVLKPVMLSSSSETESDEEDYLAELTRRAALELDLDSAKPKGVFGGGSPQSTLSAFGSSGKGSSPNGAVPQANANSNFASATFDLLHAAAGEVERMRHGGGDGDENRYGGFNFHPNAAPKPPPNNNNNNAVNANTNVNVNGVRLGFYPQQKQQQQPSLSQQQLQISQFGMMMRQQQMAKPQHPQQRQMVPPNRGRNNIGNNNNNNNSNVVKGGGGGGGVVNNVGIGSSAWTNPPPHGMMRTVYLSANRESAGTGVFLPRCVDARGANNNNHEFRKMPASKATVLVPDRVANTLNLKLEAAVAGHHKKQQQNKSGFNGGNAATAVSKVKSCNNNYNNNSNNHHNGFPHLKRNNNIMKPLQQHQPQVVNHVIHQLPQEWTY